MHSFSFETIGKGNRKKLNYLTSVAVVLISATVGVVHVPPVISVVTETQESIIALFIHNVIYDETASFAPVYSKEGKIKLDILHVNLSFQKLNIIISLII